MTLRRLTLAATLGMLLTSLVVYALTPPPPPAPTVAATIPDASDVPADVTLDRDEVARLGEELERLRALLDAAVPIDATAPDASDAASPKARITPAPRRPPAVCTVGLTPVELSTLARKFPAILSISPEEIRPIRFGSAECACSPGRDGDALCARWCAPYGRAGGACFARKCQCSP